MALATLTSPDKLYKTVVDVGSGNASQLQSKGWSLGDSGASVLPLDKALLHGATPIAPQATQVPVVPPTAPAAPVAPTVPVAPPTAPNPSNAASFTRTEAAGLLTPELKSKLQSEAPETLVAPQRTQFSSDLAFQEAQRKFSQYGNWATKDSASTGQATLQSPDGKQKTVVNVGSAEAAQLQAKGWVLGAPANAAVVNANQILTPPAPTAPVAPPPAGAQPPTAGNPQQATLQSPDGTQKAVVNVGSAEAASLQAHGWKLGAPANAAVVTPEQALNPTNPAAPMAPAGAGATDVTGAGAGGTPADANAGAPNDFNFADFFNNNPADNTSNVSPDNQALLEKYGVKPSDPSASPVQTYADTYKQLLGTLGVPNIKAEFEKVQQKYADLQNELNDKISSVNDNPWLTEGVRVGQIKSLQDKYQGRLQILTDQQKLYDSLYQQGVEEAKFVSNAAFNQQKFEADQSFNIAQLAQREEEARVSLSSQRLKDKLAIAQEMRLSAAQDSEDKLKTSTSSQNSLKNLADMFGSSFFDSLPASEKRKWETSAGLPSGTLDHLGKTIEEQKLAAKEGGGGLDTAQQNTTINQIVGAFDNEPIVRDYNTILAKSASVNKIINSGSGGPGDLAVVYEFMKALDPTSVVREAEYDAAQKSGNVFLGTLAKLNGLFNSKGGSLSPEVKQSIQEVIKSKMDVQQKLYGNLEKTYNDRINRVRSGGFNSLPDYGGAANQLNPSTTLPALNASYSSLDALLRSNPIYKDYVIQQAQKGVDEPTILRNLNTGQPITFNSGMGGTPTAQVGNLSAKYESGGNPGVIGYDSTGGYSYGTYQLAHNNAKTFVDQSPYARDFQGLALNSAQFQQKWKDIAARDPQGFEQAQHDFISKTHFQPQESKLASLGVNVNALSPTLQDVIWSTAVQHGPNNNIIVSAFNSVPKNATEEDLIKKIYQLRWNGGSNFATSTPDVQKSVYNRYFGSNGELASALRELNTA